MSPLPREMRDRWANRYEPNPGSGTVYWHMLMGEYPDVQDLAKATQAKLAPFTGFHLTPAKWLHMTTLIAGTTAEISPSAMREMVTCAQRNLGTLDPIPVTVGRILYHPEAIMLRAMPELSLVPVLDAAKEATHTQTGQRGKLNGSLPNWTPHVTIAYSTANQPAEPIIDALGTSAGSRTIKIHAVSLVVQWGPERLWDWEVIGTARFAAPKIAG